MTRTTFFKLRLIATACLLAAVPFIAPLHAEETLKEVAKRLDLVLADKKLYVEHKERELERLKELFGRQTASAEYEYEINTRLSDAYRKFQLDSAIAYAQKAVEPARQLADPALRALAEIKLAELYSYGGKFRESEDLLRRYHAKSLPVRVLPAYYEACGHFYSHYATIANQPGYSEQTVAYRDSLQAVLPDSTFSYKINLVYELLGAHRIQEAENLLHTLERQVGHDTPEYAGVAYALGVVHGRTGERDEQKKYYMLSVIADVKNAIRENQSFIDLAIICYRDGEIGEAFRYSQFAMEDAILSGMQFRTAQLSTFYSIINASYQEREARTSSKLKSYLICISLLTLFLILLVAYVYRQMRKVSLIKEKLAVTNSRLASLNAELNEKNTLLEGSNAKLSEANAVKEQYIAQFFDLCSAYIDKMEEYRKGLFKLGANKQYEALMRKLKSTTVADNEVEELYAHFDKIFLNLYPTFVTDFNNLLEEDGKIVPRKGELLNKELRIYALFRLGITDSLKIAAFLRCSLSTIYNYRTKIRNKAVCERDHFEEMVMKIGRRTH